MKNGRFILRVGTSKFESDRAEDFDFAVAVAQKGFRKRKGDGTPGVSVWRRAGEPTVIWHGNTIEAIYAAERVE